MAEAARAPRKDQLQNRRRLLDTARAVFAEQGAGVGIDAVARRAGVGTTTFYRHFPTKDALVASLLAELTGGAREVAARAAATADAWQAFTLVFTEGCVLDPADLRLFDILCRTSPAAAELGYRATADLIAPVVERAQRAGALRGDVSTDDVAAFMRMADSAHSPEQRRLAHAVMLAGLAC
ncbi:helix-turn-helix domain-containing protein [Nocardia sp. CDC153]|uniref:TetR/AcrR family transcriptional regulator n=1 Tax=Nocardia sp. CDC153 TaxID=3112167 RepID=UPI002DBBBC56|nr:helix-turn-helix domain-containing protein [Nocardia sp. CDC153]MEC3956416.1 helix-turn-helix domain-containing protein [Nocardia sp. CDC153]